MKTPAALTARAVADLRAGEAQCFEPIVLSVMDGNEVRCLTESMLDTWWANLSAGQKAEVYERDLEGDPLELVMHDGMLRGTLADLVDRIKAADTASALGVHEGAVLLFGKPKLDAAAVEVTRA